MKYLKKIFNKSDETVGYIIKEIYEKQQKEFGIQDAIILGSFEDLVKKVESLITLIEENKSAGLDLLTRSIFENYIYLKLFLSANSKFYTRSYFAQIKIKELRLYNNIKQTNKNGDKLRAFLGKDLETLNTELIKNNIVDKESILEMFHDVFLLRSYKTNWYNLSGDTNNLEQLCSKLGMYEEYELLYRLLSGEVHAMDIMKRWHLKPGAVSLIKFVNNDGIHVSLVTSYLLNSLRELYSFYNLKNELSNFNTLLAINFRIDKKN